MKRAAAVGLWACLALVASGGEGQQEASAPAPVAACPGALQPYLRTSLYMDRLDTKARTGRITDKEWHRFIDDTVQQHFPAGGTVFGNTGWWRQPNGTTGSAVGMTLVVLAPAGEAAQHREATRAVIEKFKKRYSQQAVLWEEARVCAAF